MRIGVVAPAKGITQENAARVLGFAALFHPGVEIVFHPQCFESWSHFAGPDDRRAAAFLEVANDPAFDAIWFARGGYGSNRILSTVMPRLGPAARQKTYLGFSDMGFLLGALYARGIGRPVHGSMPVNLGINDNDPALGRALAWLVNQDRAALEPNLGGKPAAAFNLSILTILTGTPWMPDLTDHVLMIEDVSEPLYRVDRMLFQIASSTQLKGIAGIRLGAINDVQPNDPPFVETPDQMIERWCRDMGVPYLGKAEIGHYTGNHVVPFGMV